MVVEKEQGREVLELCTALVRASLGIADNEELRIGVMETFYRVLEQA